MPRFGGMGTAFGHMGAGGKVAGGATSDTTAPTITSATSGSVSENVVLAFSLTASESVTWSIVGGADQARFEISGSTLRWASNGTKDFETPDDANTNNTYVVDIRATDTSSNTTDQTITITVLDVAEGITVNATGSLQYASAGLSKAYTGITVASGSNRALVLAVVWGYAVTPPSSITCVWDQAGANQSMTEIIRVDSGGAANTAALYGLVAPATGNKTLTISWTGAAEIFPAAMAFNGADQTGGAISFPHSTSSDGQAADSRVVTVTSAIGNKVMAAMGPGNGGITPTGTVIFSDASSGAFSNAAACYDDGAATVDIGGTWSGHTVSERPLVATDIKAA